MSMGKWQRQQQGVLFVATSDLPQQVHRAVQTSSG